MKWESIFVRLHTSCPSGRLQVCYAVNSQLIYAPWPTLESQERHPGQDLSVAKMHIGSTSQWRLKTGPSNMSEVSAITFAAISASNLIKADSISESDSMITFSAGSRTVQTRRIVSCYRHSRCFFF